MSMIVHHRTPSTDEMQEEPIFDGWAYHHLGGGGLGSDGACGLTIASQLNHVWPQATISRHSLQAVMGDARLPEKVPYLASKQWSSIKASH